MSRFTFSLSSTDLDKVAEEISRRSLDDEFRNLSAFNAFEMALQLIHEARIASYQRRSNKRFDRLKRQPAAR
jgi:hypothetical protein